MSEKKKIRKEEIERLGTEERMKYEIAEELGLLPKVLESGWRSLTSKETGRIGGLVTKKKRELSAEEETAGSGKA